MPVNKWFWWFRRHVCPYISGQIFLGGQRKNRRTEVLHEALVDLKRFNKTSKVVNARSSLSEGAVARGLVTLSRGQATPRGTSAQITAKHLIWLSIQSSVDLDLQKYSWAHFSRFDCFVCFVFLLFSAWWIYVKDDHDIRLLSREILNGLSSTAYELKVRGACLFFCNCNCNTLLL